MSPESAPFNLQARREALWEIVTDPVRMRNVLERHLQPADDRRVQIVSCRPGGLRTREDCRFAIQYDVRVHDPATDTAIALSVSGVSYPAGKTRAVWDSLRAEMPFPHDAFFHPYAYVPGLDMLIQLFPHDHHLPGLASLMTGTPRELESSFISDLDSGGWRLESSRSEVVRYRVGLRATVRLTVGARRDAPDERAERVYYAKLYRDADRARHAFEILELLTSRMEDGSVRFSAPAPIAHVEDFNAVIQTHVPGVPLLRHLRRERAAMRAVRAAGQAVAELHGLALEAPRLPGREAPRSLQHRLSRLERAGELIGGERPDLVPEVASIVSAVKDSVARAPVAPIHGDLKPDHFLVDGDAVALIDFDDMQASDPMLDVANMESHLARLQPDIPLGADREESIARAFVESYFAHAPDATRVRLSAYRVMANLGEVARRQRSNDPGWRERIGDVVREARASLEIEG